MEGVSFNTARNEEWEGILYAHAPTPNSHIDAARIKKKNRGVGSARKFKLRRRKGAPLKCANQPTNHHVTFFDRSSANPLLFLGGGGSHLRDFVSLLLRRIVSERRGRREESSKNRLASNCNIFIVVAFFYFFPLLPTVFPHIL